MSFFNGFSFNSVCMSAGAYIIFVADTADIVCGATFFMWSSFAPPDTIVRHVEQSYHVKQWQIAPHLQCGAICQYST